MRALALAPVAAALLLTPALADPPPAGTLAVRIDGLRSDKGQVACTLYGSAKGYPTDPKLSLGEQWCRINNKVAQCRFPSVTAGTYALACYHDENDNHQLDFGFLHIPKEGGGASRGARGVMGPPRWKDAHFDFAGKDAEEPVTIRY